LVENKVFKRHFADEAKPTSQNLQVKALPQLSGELPEFFKFTLACPHKELFVDVPVRMVGIPGSVGRFAVTPGHVPIIAEIHPGVLSLYHERTETSGRQDHLFVAGGIAMVHPNAELEISAVEAVPLQDIDITNVRDGLSKARDKLTKASDEKSKYEAEIEIETYEAIERALGTAQH